MKHTPGPWIVEEEPAGVLVTSQSPGLCVSVSIPGQKVVALDRANARLIAAAPDGLSVAKRAYAVLGSIHNEWPDRHTREGQALLCDLRDFICKATGREAQDVQDDYPNRINPLAKATEGK